MKKIILLLIPVLFLAFLPAVSATADTASGVYLHDDAGLFDSQQKEKLEKELSAASSKTKGDIVIFTEPFLPEEYRDVENGDYYYYAEQLYDKNGYSDDGMMLLFCDGEKGERFLGIYAVGDRFKSYYDGYSGSLFDEVENYCVDDDFFNGFCHFARTVASLRDFRFGMWLAVAAGVGILAGVIRSAALKSQLKSVIGRTDAQDYIRKGSFVLSKSYDIPTYITVEKRRIVKNNPPGSTVTGPSGKTVSGSHGTV